MNRIIKRTAFICNINLNKIIYNVYKLPLLINFMCNIKILISFETNKSFFVLQAQRWCDDGAYLLANQQVDKFQSKLGAQAALRDIEKFQEVAPPLLGAGVDVLFLEYESVLTPCLQVNTSQTTEMRLDPVSVDVWCKFLGILLDSHFRNVASDGCIWTL